MIAIIGAGISGLALAHHLAARGRPFVVLEATDRAGGVIRSARVDGHLLEWGPQRARLTREFSELVDALGLRDRLITAPADLPLFVYRAGRLRRVPFSAIDFLRSDLLGRTGRLRVLLEPLTAGADDDETVARYFTRKLGREAYDTLAGPLYGGLYASDPADMIVGLSLRHALREFGVKRSLLLRLLKRGGRVRPPAACSFVEGLEELPRALFRQHREHVRLRTEALRLTPHAGGGWAVETTQGSLRAEHVVLTVPARAAANLLRDAAPEQAQRIGALIYNPLAVVHLVARIAVRGMGYQVSLAEEMVTRGVTWNHSLFGREGVNTVYLGGAKNPWVATETHERLARIAMDEFRAVTGAEARLLSVANEWIPAWDRSWQAIQSLDLPDGLHVHANWASRPGIPGRLAGARDLSQSLAGAHPPN